MRTLTVVTVGMGALILLGTAVLLVLVLRRAAAPAPVPALALSLHQPAGTAIAGIAAAGGRLAIALHGGGPDRVVVVDPRTGAVAGRIRLGP